MGMRGNWIGNGWCLSHVTNASLNIGLADFLIVLDVFEEPQAAADTYLLQKVGGAPLRGVYLIYSAGKPSLMLYDVGGAPITYSAGMDISHGRNILLFFTDRDGNAYIYVNGSLSTLDITATNVDQDNAGHLVLLYGNVPNYRSQPLLSYQQYNFGVGGLPNATERAQIVAEASADPSTIPATLAARPAHATELRLALDFSDMDSAANAVTDNSAYGNDMSLSGGALWSTVGREMKAPTRVLTPDGGPTYGLRDGVVQQAGLTGIAIGTNDVIIEFFLKKHIQDTALSTELGDFYPRYLLLANAAVTHYIQINERFPNRIYAEITDAGGVLYAQDFYIDRLFEDALHLFMVVRSTSVVMMINGHSLRTTIKNAHNIISEWLRFFGAAGAPIPQTPSTACILRLYVGNLTLFSNQDLLGIHRQYAGSPYETPTVLLPYEVFRFTGRQPGGAQILTTDTNVYNEAPGSVGYGEVLAIQGLNWGQVRRLVHQP